ncbi:MAG TPA: ATP-binding protein [Rhizomicrobium sp.]|nr:ATP-binding protein [Rhizomicrobium sp.]
MPEATELPANGRAWPQAGWESADPPGWWTELSPHHKYLRLAVGLCIFTTAYFLAFKFSVDPASRAPSPFWLPNSILLCALLRSRPRHWWLFLLLTIPIRLMDNVIPPHPVWYRAGMIAVSAAQALAGAWAFRLIAPQHRRFGSWQEWLAMVVVILIAAAASFALAGLRHALGEDFLQAFQLAFAGDALALVVVTPAVLTWLFWEGAPVAPLSTTAGIEALLLLAALLVTSYLAFISAVAVGDLSESKFFLPVPLLYWAALRFGMAGASIAVLIVTAFAIHSHPLLQMAGLLRQMVPFSAYLGMTPATMLSRFLFFRAAPVYAVAGLMERQHRVQLSVRESEVRFRNMADTAPVLIWMSGPDKLCDFFNQVWLDFTGRPLEAELGNGWAEGVHPGDLEQCLHIYQTAFDAREPFRMEYRLRNRDGEYRWILDIGVPRFDTGNVFRGYIGSAIDITEQRQAQENNAHIAHLQRLSQMGELTASIAHELRQPLSAILMNSGTLRLCAPAAGESEAKIKEILADIDQNCQRATDVLKTIHNQVRKHEEKFEPVDVNSVVLDCISLISGESRQRRIRILTELAGTLPPVQGVRTEIMQVLLNLVTNAMDAMEKTPASGRYVMLKTLWVGNAIQVSVLDRGHGIKPENMASLFDSFFTTRASGMGLGLSIVRSIVEAHRGRIWAENLESGGAGFHFTLPASSQAGS